MENIKLSIVIPVYNVQDYLADCLESVYDVNEQSKEIIIINDGSTDNSAFIIEQYKNKYPLQTQVITQHNQGLSAARNAGINASKGKFILFLDSDDTLESEPVFNLIQFACDNDLDILQGVATKFGDVPKEQLSMPQDVFDYPICNGRDFLNKYGNSSSIAKKNFRPEAWLMLVKRDLFIKNNIYFTEGMYFEDELMTPTLYLNANKVKALDMPFYNYRIRAGSITSVFNEKHIASKALLVKEYYSLLAKSNFYHSFLNGRLIGWCRESEEYLSIKDVAKLFFLRKYRFKDLLLLNMILIKKVMNFGRFKNVKDALNVK
ncbi:glycosyltransferase, partial [Pseudoalteromonas sp. SR45-5]|uniref:glycosyltransferase n=1 Tax=Pseudoalteromonas sp. SR45-5 TaxID=2760928 RepID=UPI0015F851AA